MNVFVLVKERHFPLPLRKSLQLIAEGDFLVLQEFMALQCAYKYK